MEYVPTTTRIEDIEISAENLDPARAAEIYQEHGCLVIRGLMTRYIDAIARDIEDAAKQSIALLPQAKQVPEGWVTPNGTLFLPAPANYDRDKQIMVLGIGYFTSAAFFLSAFHEPLVEVVCSILGANVELFLNGQCLYKEPVGGHPKKLHQDSAYFEHKFEGPVGALNYVVETNVQNGALHVVPGSHRWGTLQHVDTFSHLGLDEAEWSWERAVPICGSPGDTILFHVRTIHGSKENYTEKPRPVFIHRYRRADDFVTISGTTVANRAEAEKRAESVRKENQKGLMVRGYRPYVEDER